MDADTIGINKDATFLSGGGEVGSRMRDFDWSRTPLGPLERWPQSLRTSVSTCLNSRFAIVLWWGKELVALYNDAYAVILGTKHPAALGAPAHKVWPEIWSIIAPMLNGVLERGDATWSDNLLLELEREGYPEELYFTFSYSPIRDESGGIGGIFTPVQETTGAVIGERRLRTLRDLAEAAGASNARSEEEVCRVAAETLAKNCQDIPFAAFYLYSPAGAPSEGSEARLTGSSGFSEASTLFPAAVSLGQNDWLFADALRSGTVSVVDLPPGLESVPCGAWPVQPGQAMVLPIAPAGQPIGAIILGVSPRKRLDEDYRSFLSLVGGHVTTAVAEARAFAEERRRAEALAELDRAKTAFFSNVSHEFRTPLTLMLGPLEEMLAMKAVPAAITELAAVTHRNGLRLQKLVNTLLDFSRIEAGRLQATFEATDLARYTAELASAFRAAVEKAGLRLVVDCPPLAEPVFVDGGMWEKIVLNLLSNAFKYTFDGEISVRLGVRGEQVILSVADTGTGIPERELPHLFERFHRVEGARGRTQEGTGIGLALVAELTRLHGGAVEVSSKVGAGSVFTVSLPLGSGHLALERVVAAPAKSTAVSAGTWFDSSGFSGQKARGEGELTEARKDRVMVVDDNADMRAYIARLLADHYSVTIAANGEEALARILEDPPDLVLSDVMMPILDGFALIEALRKNPRTHALPVILLSARAGEEAGVEGLRAGASDYLVKPFTARELLARVGTHLEMARIRREAVVVLESITDGFIALDREWRFTYVNAAAERMFGMRGEQLLGRSHWDVFPETLGSVGDREYHRAVREQVSVEFELFYEPWQRWYYVRAYPVRTEGLSIYFRDVTEQKGVQAALEESEKRFRAMADSAPVLIWTTDETGACSWVNRPWLDFTGRTLKEELGFGWTSGVHPDELDEIMAVHRSAHNLREPFHRDHRLRRRDGEWRWILVHANPLFDSDGTFTGYIGSCADITDRKRAEEALRESEARFRTLADNIPNLAWMAHADGETFWYNQRWYEYTGTSTEEMLGWGWRNVHDPALLPLVMEIWRSSLVTGRGFAMEFPLRGRDGTFRWFLTQARPIRNEAGEVVRWFGTNTDIDNERQAREALRQSEELARSVIEGSPDSVEVLDLGGRTILINQQGRRLFERSERTPGAEWAESWSGENGLHAAQAFDAVLTGHAARFEATARPASGAPMWLDVFATPLLTPTGVVSRVLSITRDVTTARRAEEELRQTARLESLGVMAGGIAHDFNNLLTGILGNASLIRETAREEDREMADDIVLAAERAADLTKQMLAFSGKGRFQICKTDLSVMVRDMLRLAKPSIEKNVEVQLDLGSQCILEGDPGQLQQVVMNLMINAAEAMEGRPGLIVIRTVRVEADAAWLARAFGVEEADAGSSVLLEVADNGKGMDEVTKGRIFDPFFTTKFTGRGLGLAAVSGIVRGHRGLLRVQSTPGEGTTFKVLFPAARSTAAVETRSEEVERPGRGVVLLVDDEDIVRRLGAEVLKRHGYEVRVASDGKEALDVFRAAHHEIDAIILDMMMPVMNGEDALRGLHQIDASVPVIMCSGQNEAEVIRRLTAQKVGAFLQKPYTAARLLEKVRAILLSDT